EYFRQKLLAWRSDLLDESRTTRSQLRDHNLAHPDLVDRATLEADNRLALRTSDRERKLIAKIDQALERIERGTYGYCTATGEPIAIQRLEARPVATLSLEAQKLHEQKERTHREES
ncbi:MAG: RNA polymerase-binding protein DksA, partial [Pseudomonadota bacterium]